MASTERFKNVSIVKKKDNDLTWGSYTIIQSKQAHNVDSTLSQC